MNRLPEQKIKNGCHYTLVKRCNRYAIYSQRYSPNGPIIGYEVFLIKIAPSYMLAGISFEEGESFPHNEAFGKWAWAFNSLSGAEIKYNELNMN